MTLTILIVGSSLISFILSMDAIHRRFGEMTYSALRPISCPKPGDRGSPTDSSIFSVVKVYGLSIRIQLIRFKRNIRITLNLLKHPCIQGVELFLNPSESVCAGGLAEESGCPYSSCLPQHVAEFVTRLSPEFWIKPLHHALIIAKCMWLIVFQKQWSVDIHEIT